MRKAADLEYADASRQITQMKALEDRKTGLLHKVEVSSSLLERVPRSTLLAHLTSHLPPHTTLSNLTMRAVEVDEPAPAAAAAPGAPGAAKKPPAMVKVRRIEFVLTGLAQTDVDVAKYIGRLCADPLFQEIDLKFSEEFPYKETIRMRRFEITLFLSPKAGELLERAPAPKTVAAAPSDPGPLARGEL
jgi:Tfp pilus assembly protein PilN